MRDIEIVPLIFTEDLGYEWVSMLEAEFFTVYERDEEGSALALVDVPHLDAGLAYVEHVIGQQETRLWTGVKWWRLTKKE